MSKVVNVTRHCIYLPEGSPDITGEVPPTEVQEGVAASLRNDVSDALTSNVMSVLACSVSSQNDMFHFAPAIPVSCTCEANVPEEQYKILFTSSVPMLQKVEGLF